MESTRLDYVRECLKCLGFSLQNGSEEIWSKKYDFSDLADYTIVVKPQDGEHGIVCYGDKSKHQSERIVVSSKDSSSFHNLESIAVLECVDRLLTIGYKPNCIELERTWPSGRGTSGSLDICVKIPDANNSCSLKPWLMIECKTWGDQYVSEMKNMLNSHMIGNNQFSKGQLFNYFQNEKNTTKYLCLYTSHVIKNKVERETSIIEVKDNWQYKNHQEIFDDWDKTFKQNGIFEDTCEPYNISIKAGIVKSNLKDLTDQIRKQIFGDFKEILRHNAISDKPNAFNKLLNLFIAKIIDENNTPDDEEVQFQWIEGYTTYEILLDNLSKLYKQGMDEFLSIKTQIIDEKELEKYLIAIDCEDIRASIRDMFKKAHLHENADFNFKEVYDEESFRANAKVVKEVVLFLQRYKFRYGHKQQFLGDFFEDLLNTSMKQEAGQFFTPLPITRFMVSALPMESVITNNIKSRKSVNSILPTAIDYACGSGHFLTEYMDVLQNIINAYDIKSIKGTNYASSLLKWKQTSENDLAGEFEWAENTVYGIEKDYRLVKATKIATFLNGDGKAKIIHADGLGKFGHYGSQYPLLEEPGKFDFVIANPPFSVSAFRQEMKANQDDFTLYNLLNPKSKEIECLFVERTAQLLKENGIAAIILPTPLLSNPGELLEKTREILFENFKIISIMVLGQKTFMATGTNTVVLFLKKRNVIETKTIESLINNFFASKIDFNFNGHIGVVKEYLCKQHIGLHIDDYLRCLCGVPIQSTFVRNYTKDFLQSKEYDKLLKNSKFKKLNNAEKQARIDEEKFAYIQSQERLKLYYFLLTLGDNTLIIHTETSSTKKEKEFLGYEFKDSKEDYGIKILKDEAGNIMSCLYNDQNLFNDSEKINYYIRHAIAGHYPPVSANLSKYIQMIDTNELLDFAKCNFSNCLILEKQVKATYDCPTIDLGELCDIKIGGTPSRNNHLYFRGNNLWLSIKEMNGQCITDTVEKITDEAIKTSNVKKIKKGTTLISFKLSLGKVAVAGVDLYTNEAIAGLEIVDDNLCLNEYLFELFRLGCINFVSSTKSFGNSLNSKTLKTLQIPHLSIDEQRKFIEIAKREQPLDFGSIKDVEQIVKLRTQKFNNIYSQVNS